jgi:hypothetical protein
LYKFDNYFTTLKGSLICIYTDQDKLCASNYSPYIFFENLQKNKKKLDLYFAIDREKYVKICRTVGIKFWMDEGTYEFFKNKLFLGH